MLSLPLVFLFIFRFAAIRRFIGRGFHIRGSALAYGHRLIRPSAPPNASASTAWVLRRL